MKFFGQDIQTRHLDCFSRDFQKIKPKTIFFTQKMCLKKRIEKKEAASKKEAGGDKFLFLLGLRENHRALIQESRYISQSHNSSVSKTMIFFLKGTLKRFERLVDKTFHEN